MESGKQQFEKEQSSEAIAFISLGSNGEDNFSLVHSLVSEASANYPQLSQLRFVQVPLPVSKLEGWSYWLAAQVVMQWRELPAEDDLVTSTVEELGLESAEGGASLLAALDKTATDTSLTLQLATRVKSLKEWQPQQKLASSMEQWLEQEAAELAEWFNPQPPIPCISSQPLMEASACLVQLHSNFIALRSKALCQLQGYFVRLQQGGPLVFLRWLGALSEALDGIRANYEAQRQNLLRLESSAWRAYYSLSAPLKERKWRLFDRDQRDWEAVLRAITTAYEFKLEAEIYTQAAQLVGELVQQTRLFAAEVAQVDTVLASLQSWLTQRCSVEPLFVPFLRDSLAKRVNTTQLRSEIETWMGCNLNNWGALDSTQTVALCEQILARTWPLTLEVYADCYRSILNLDPPNLPTQAAITAQASASPLPGKIPTDSEKRVSLQVHNADIRDVLTILARVGQVCVVVDESISGTVSLALDDLPFTEALKALTVASNLTYSKSNDIYTFFAAISSPSS